MTQDTVTIHVQVFDAINVIRPTEAISLGDDIYKLLPTPDYDPEDEDWEFRPGAIVRCEHNTKDWLIPCLLAVEQIEPPEQTAQIHVKWVTKLGGMFKPRQAISLGKNLYQLLPSQEQNEEAGLWEFMPGDTVRCEQAWGRDGVYGLLAVERVG